MVPGDPRAAFSLIIRGEEETMEKRDVIIIGGGPAGYGAAIRVAQLGGIPILIENDSLGGTCLNRGCVPTRALARAVELLEAGKNAKDYGITYKELSIDFAKTMSRKDTVVKTLVAGVKLLLGGNGVKVLEGKARCVSPSQIEVEQKDGTKRTLEARRIIIATGSRCKETSLGNRSPRILNTTQALELTAIPPSMVIVGGGFVGVTFATIFSKLGCSVSLIEESPGMLKEIDKEAVAVLEKELKRAKVRVYVEARVSAMEEGEGDTVNVQVEAKGQATTLNSHYVLMAEERETDVDALGLKEIGVVLNGKKGVATGRTMETSIPGIFAAGDVTMEHMWTPVAYAEGIVAADNTMGLDTEIDYSAIPYWVSSVPEVAGVGLTEDQAVAQGYSVRVGRFPFAANGMATILGERTGFVKMVVDERYYQILGVHIVGPRATDLIAEAALALKLEVTPEDIGRTFHAHPSLSEALWEAAKDVSGEAIHFITKR